MGVMMSNAATLSTLQEFFPEDSDAYKKATMLMASPNVIVSFGLLQFVVRFGADTVFSAILPKMVSAIVKLPPTDPVRVVAVEKIVKTIEDGFIELAKHSAVHVDPGAGDSTASVVVPPAPSKSSPFKVPPSAKEIAAVESAKSGGPAELVSSVISLETAKAIGQKVKGTSASAVYRCCAIARPLSPTAQPAKFAYRKAGSTMSLRCSPKSALSASAQSHMKMLGFSDQGSYMSIHVSLGTVPPMRAMGALLFSTGLEFAAIASTEGQLNV